MTSRTAERTRHVAVVPCIVVYDREGCTPLRPRAFVAYKCPPTTAQPRRSFGQRQIDKFFRWWRWYRAQAAR